MRTIQEIFNLIIQEGMYTPAERHSSYDSRQYVWMCHALYTAHADGLITSEELETTQAAIHEYTAAGGEQEHTMCEVLFALGLVDERECATFDYVRPRHCADQLLAIYMDWENRHALPEDLYLDYDD